MSITYAMMKRQPIENEGFVYSILEDKDYDETVEMVLKPLAFEELLARGLHHTEEDVRGFLSQVKSTYIKNEISIIARNVETGKVVGLMLAKDHNYKDEIPTDKLCLTE
jgi:hypothetical protein